VHDLHPAGRVLVVVLIRETTLRCKGHRFSRIQPFAVLPLMVATIAALQIT